MGYSPYSGTVPAEFCEVAVAYQVRRLRRSVFIVSQIVKLSPYLFVIGLIKLPPSDAKVKVTFPTIPSSLSNVTRYLLSHQGFAVADAVVVSSIVTASAVHNTFFFIIFHLLNLYLPFRQHKHTTEDDISLRSFFKVFIFV